MSSGQYIRLGTKIGTTYPESGEAMWDLMEDFYSTSYAFAKSAGAATYGDNGYFNAVYGRDITAAMFTSDRVFASIGARPYNHEGVRIAPEMADYGLNSSDEFVGIGAGVPLDGDVPDSVRMPVYELREPVAVFPFSYDYGLGLQVLEHKEDDVSSYQSYVDMMAANYTNLLDQALVSPLYLSNTVLDTESGSVETGMNSIDRIISGYDQIGATQDSATVTAADVSPWGGRTASGGDFYQFRSAGKSNFDCQVIDNGQATLSLDNMYNLHTRCAVNWNNSAAPNNKAFYMSNIALTKLAQIMQAYNTQLNSVRVQRSFNGVKTWPGRDAGNLLNSFLNIPIVVDGNLNFDYTNKAVSATSVGNIYLMDLDHIWMSVLTPVEMFSNANAAITRTLKEKNVMVSRMQSRADSFIQHGKIVNIAA